STQALETAKAETLKNIKFAPLLNRTLPKLSPDQALKRVEFTGNLKAVSACEFIVENVTEDWEIKKAVYRELDQIAPANVCFGCNTSCLSITRIASLTSRPDKVIGIHFMNPVHLKPTVEVIRGHHTS